MELPSEVDRLRAVYRAYGERGWGKTKWAAANEGNRAIRRERDRQLEQLLRNTGLLPLPHRRILEVGCGDGSTLTGFRTWGATPENLFGVDLLPDRIQQARDKYPDLHFQAANAETLPFANGTFELVATFTLFTSILDRQMAAQVSREIDRVLSPEGAVIWYDFRMNNPFNRHVRGMTLQDIRRLFPAYRIRGVTLTLLPPLARRLGRLTKPLYRWLASFSFLRSHYLGVLRKP